MAIKLYFVDRLKALKYVRLLLKWSDDSSVKRADSNQVIINNDDLSIGNQRKLF